jgi:endonuclease/exonuclease/phosphatase family metal-dependent hydrolase
VRVACAFVAALVMAAGCAHPLREPFNSATVAELSCRQVQPPDAPRPEWIGPADARSRFRLSRWCETVGPVFFNPQPLAISPPSVDALAIVSWNIHEGRGDADDLIQRLRAGEFTGGERIDQFVLLLQEAIRQGDGVPLHVSPGYPTPRRIHRRPGAADHDVRNFVEQGFAVLYAPSMRNGESAEDRGNAIVSTLPIAQPKVIELPLERQRRVVVAAAIEGSTQRARRWRLTLVDVHLDTSLALMHGGPSAARRRQTAALLDALGAPLASADAGTLVVAGDFNTWMGDREAAVQLLRREFAGPPVRDTGSTWTGPLGLHARLDHIFARGAGAPSAVTRLPSRFGSDHYPLLTIVRF